MFYAVSFIFLALATTWFFFLRDHVTTMHSSIQPNMWSKLNHVGVSSRGPFRWARAILSSILSSRKFATEGYVKFCKALGQPFVLPTTWTGHSLLVVPPHLVHLLLTRSDKLPESEITNIPGLIETVQLPFVINDPEIYRNVIHFEVVRKKMAKKDMHLFAPTTAEEIGLAYKDIFGTSTVWETINGWDACGQVISRTAERIMVGLPLARNKELLENSRKYATSVLLGGVLMNCFPPFLRMFVGPLIALRARYYQARCVKALLPTVKERLRLHATDQKPSDIPDDFLQWLIATCAKDGYHQLDARRIANRLTALMTPLIFAVCYVFANTVVDLYSSDSKEEFLAGLLAECQSVSEKYGGLSVAEAVDSLYRVDSTVRESMRVSDVAVTNLFRDVVSGHVDLGGDIKVTKGMRMTFPTQNIHLDSDNYKNPRQFDAFRFSRNFEGTDTKVQNRELVSTPTTSFLPLGYGRHACPGRWFAAQTIKQALAYMILNYDVEIINKPGERKALVNTMVPPVDTRLRIRAKRQAEE